MNITFDTNVWERVINEEEHHLVEIKNRILDGKIHAYNLWKRFTGQKKNKLTIINTVVTIISIVVAIIIVIWFR